MWDLRFNWPDQQASWLALVLSGQYRLSPIQVGDCLQRPAVAVPVDGGCEIRTPPHSIGRGSALSSLIGGSLLWHVDMHFGQREGLFYARYVDDFVVFTRTRWHLRRAIRDQQGFFELGGFEAHSQKTPIGRKEHGFDWPGGAGMTPRDPG